MTKYMDLKEFVEKGFLQEANRNFFHPLGLALAINFDDLEGVSLHGIIDSREDPEGYLFQDESMSDRVFIEKARYVNDLRNSKVEARVPLGCNEFGIQMVVDPIKPNGY